MFLFGCVYMEIAPFVGCSLSQISEGGVTCLLRCSTPLDAVLPFRGNPRFQLNRTVLSLSL